MTIISLRIGENYRKVLPRVREYLYSLWYVVGLLHKINFGTVYSFNIMYVVVLKLLNVS